MKNIYINESDQIVSEELVIATTSSEAIQQQIYALQEEIYFMEQRIKAAQEQLDTAKKYYETTLQLEEKLKDKSTSPEVTTKKKA